MLHTFSATYHSSKNKALYISKLKTRDAQATSFYYYALQGLFLRVGMLQKGKKLLEGQLKKLSGAKIPYNIPLSQQHTFIAKTSGNLAITFITFLARKNIPMKTYKVWNSVRTEGKIILVVEE